MYKTVRQGNASLQYTILPQKEDYDANEMSSVVTDSSEPSSAKVPSPTVEDKICGLCNRFEFTLTESRYLGFRIISCLIFCGIALYLMDQWGDVVCARNRCQIGSPEETTENNTDKNYETDDSTDSKITTSSGSNFTNIFDDNRPPVDSIKTSTSGSTSHDDVSSNFELTINAETTLSTTEETPTTTLSSSTELPTTTFPSTLEVSSTEESSDSRSSVKSAPTVSIVNILKRLKMLKMPRVTLKLRTNDTIPQMYIKSGIASYKKGKITTSVVAQGLSLEGLIFKTPEGTIKPWREKWPFAEDSDMFQRKHDGIVWKDLMAVMVIFLMGLSVIMGLQLLTISRRQWNRIEEIDVEIQDDLSSSLLDVQCQDLIDKE